MFFIPSYHCRDSLEPQGMVIPESLGRADPWEARVAVARALELIAEDVYGQDRDEQAKEKNLADLFTFLTNSGALGDRSGPVRRGMLDAGIRVLDVSGTEAAVMLIKVFEDYLANADVVPKATAQKKGNEIRGVDTKGQANEEAERADHTKEAVVVLLGRVARYLPAGDARIPGVVSRLVDALKTPSEAVQMAVAGCLAGLVGGMKGSSVCYVHVIFDFRGSRSRRSSQSSLIYYSSRQFKLPEKLEGEVQRTES